MAKLRVDKIAAPIVKDEFTGSVYFDGTGDYLSMPDSTDFTMGTGDYTIEGWFYFNATGTNRLFGQRNSSAGESQLLGEFYDGHTISYYHSIGDTVYAVTKTNIISLQTWYHIAITRHNQVLHLYVDGVLQSTNTTTGSLDDRAQPFVIGRQGNFTSNTFNGYISNFRICKGHAVYTGNFTPPTRELPVHTAPPKGVVFPAVDNRTVLLACQSSTDATADATKRHTITAYGNTTAADANPGLFRKTNITSTITENTGSVFFDGTDDSLNIAANADFAYGTGDFTWEFWFKTDAGFVEGDGGYLIDHAPADSNGNDGAVLVGSNTLKYHSAPLGGVTNLLFGSVSNETWYHVAVARESGTTRLFLDGLLVNSASDSANYTTSNTRFRIGDYIGTNYAFKGYISNLRICKGHAVYTSTFTPPTTELEVHPETVLLACYDGENIFADKTGRHIIAAIGDRLSSPTPTATDSPIGITTNYPPVTRNVDPTDGPTFQGGAGFVSQNWLTLPKGTTTDRNPKLSNAVSHGSARGIFGAIQVFPTAGDSIHYATIATFGNTVDFGDLSVARRYAAGCSSKTRGLFAGGAGTVPADKMNTIEYITIATTGNSKDFGDLITARWGLSAFSNSTRGIFFSGNTTPANTNVIEYVTISTLGNALDFGDAFSTYRYVGGSTSDTTRGISAGGYSDSGRVNTIQYVTMASTGNAQDFGDLLAVVQGGCGGVSNGTRGVFAGGYNPTQVNTIEYITIQSMGNSNDFGDMTSTDARNGSSAESSIRGLFQHGGYPGRLNTIDAITIATTGNAVEFGDIIDIGGNDGGGDSGTQCGFSNGHGGLG